MINLCHKVKKVHRRSVILLYCTLSQLLRHICFYNTGGDLHNIKYYQREVYIERVQEGIHSTGLVI